MDCFFTAGSTASTAAAQAALAVKFLIALAAQQSSARRLATTAERLIHTCI